MPISPPSLGPVILLLSEHRRHRRDHAGCTLYPYLDEPLQPMPQMAQCGLSDRTEGLPLSLKAGQKTLAWRRAEEGGARAERQVARRDGQVSNSRDARAHCVCSFRSVVDPACLPACARWLRRACGRHALTLCNVYVFGDTLCTRRPCCPCVGQQRTRWEVEG